MGLPVLITCEHASCALPDGVSLGVSPDVLTSHVGWDRGASEVATALAQSLATTALLGDYTRLLVDLNRSASNPHVIAACAFGVQIPVNQRLNQEAFRQRIDQYHRPYWDAVGQRLRAAVATHGQTWHVSIHSFTPDLDPEARDFDIGVLFDADSAQDSAETVNLAKRLRVEGYGVRFNEPYPGSMDLITTAHRALFDPRQYIGIEIEINHRLMRDGWLAPLVGCLSAWIHSSMNRAP